MKKRDRKKNSYEIDKRRTYPLKCGCKIHCNTEKIPGDRNKYPMKSSAQ